jgi:excisionase family DNA binding protein
MKQNEEQNMDAAGAESTHKRASGRFDENEARTPLDSNFSNRASCETHNSGEITGNVERIGRVVAAPGREQSPANRLINDTRLKTPSEAADYLRCSIRTLWEWKADGSLGYHRKGRWVRFAVDDLDKVIAKAYVPARDKLPRKRRMLRTDQEGRSE